MQLSSSILHTLAMAAAVLLIPTTVESCQAHLITHKLRALRTDEQNASKVFVRLVRLLRLEDKDYDDGKIRYHTLTDLLDEDNLEKYKIEIVNAAEMIQELTFNAGLFDQLKRFLAASKTRVVTGRGADVKMKRLMGELQATVLGLRNIALDLKNCFNIEPNMKRSQLHILEQYEQNDKKVKQNLAQLRNEFIKLRLALGTLLLNDEYRPRVPCLG